MEMISKAIRRGAAKKLRANTTPHERILWRALKELPVEGTHFRRQAPIGPYVVDFFCPAKKLIIELDGGQHATRDETNRTRALEAMGYLVLRFWNNDVLQNTEGVLEEILNTVGRHPQEPPHPVPLPSGERGRFGATDV